MQVFAHLRHIALCAFFAFLAFIARRTLLGRVAAEGRPFLLSRGLIEEMGEEGEFGATLYGTTSYFLQRLGLGSLDELPALAPYLPEVDVLDELAALTHDGRA